MKIVGLLGLITLGLFSFNSTSTETSVVLKVRNIRNLKGQLQVAVFKNEEQFEGEQPEKTLYFNKTNVKEGKINLAFNLAQGTYAVTVLDDEDKSKDMTFRFGVYPLEGVGFSGYKLEGMSKPDFNEFDFQVDDEKKYVDVAIHYF
ncbi:Uncharacterized conserved protein, DUF2141 family [Lishizhenia tianjinensis]|uniref:Uncharacterized conserved protein, DUF2141 family n=1 Tax=Lishizhenia tianjinensis TaxID=477690 RepID=A0A1I7AVS2_9FLAO|nr:DUF2141 domain-containing protein [Lishizhenia tianjinensis]SFT79011.1 Uncharacterized conserved protein, DUF2141 family [Lishizhenia tianjinensis]